MVTQATRAFNAEAAGVFTKVNPRPKIRQDQKRGYMSNTVPAAPPVATPLSGEAIRLMNYVDDVSTTLRRVLALAPTLTDDERKRLSEYLKNSSPNADTVLEALKAK
jgi:hypothetical protein